LDPKEEAYAIKIVAVRRKKVAAFKAIGQPRVKSHSILYVREILRIMPKRQNPCKNG